MSFLYFTGIDKMITLVDYDNSYAYIMWYLQQPIKKNTKIHFKTKKVKRTQVGGKGQT